MTATVRLDYPFNALVSYHYFAGKDVGALARGGLRIIGDSGAYSAASQGATIHVDTFADWAHTNRPHLAWVASLDVIGDPHATWDNYRHLRHRRGLDVVPTVHYGSPPQALDRYADEDIDLVGLGGMVPHKSSPGKLLRWCLAMFRHARDRHPGMRFHGWGVNHPDLLANLPWWSVDSSGAGAAYRYGRATLWDPPRQRTVNVTLDGRGVHAHGDLLRRHYGVEPATVATSGPGNRRTLVRLAGRSLQLREQWLKARHHVTPPRYGVNPTGPNLHYAETTVKDLDAMTSPAPLGPHLHFADTDPGNLRDLTGPHVHFADARPHIVTELTQETP